MSARRATAVNEPPPSEAAAAAPAAAAARYQRSSATAPSPGVAVFASPPPPLSPLVQSPPTPAASDGAASPHTQIAASTAARVSPRVAASVGVAAATSNAATPQPPLSQQALSSAASRRTARFRVTYLGDVTLDRRATSAMLHWIVAEIRRRPNVDRAALMIICSGGGNVKLTAERDSSDVLCEHSVHTVARFSRFQDDHRCFFYLQRNSADVPFVVYAFAADDADKVPDIFQEIRVATQNSLKLVASGGGLSASHSGSMVGVNEILALGDSSVKRYRMRYQGRVFVGEKKASGQFIDDWLSHREEEARRLLSAAASTCSDSSSISASSVSISSRRKRSSELGLFRASSVVSTDSGVLVDGSSNGGAASQRRSRHNSAESGSPLWRRSHFNLDDTPQLANGDDGHLHPASGVDGVRGRDSPRLGDDRRLSRSLDRGSHGSTERLCSAASSSTSDGDAAASDELLACLPGTGGGKETDDDASSGATEGGGQCDFELDGISGLSALDEAAEAADRFANRRTTLIGTTDLHRTMLLQIGTDRIAFISLDKKTVILQKSFKEISYCTQGSKDADHFGFICRDGRSGKFVMYVFQCATDDVVSEIMASLKKAFAAAQHRTDESAVCDLCPMQQLHRLCSELNGIRDPETMYNMIHGRIQNLAQSDYSQLMNKVKTEQCESFAETNEVLMTKLRIMCELRQLDHVHVRPGADSVAAGGAGSSTTPTSAGKQPIAADKEFNLMGPPKNQSKLAALRTRAKKAFSLDRFSWKPSRGHDGKGRSASGFEDEVRLAKEAMADDAASPPSPTLSSSAASLGLLGTSPPNGGDGCEQGVRRRSAPAETAPWGGSADARSARRLASFGGSTGSGLRTMAGGSLEEQPSGSDTEGCDGTASCDDGAGGGPGGSCASSSSSISLAAYSSVGKSRSSKDFGASLVVDSSQASLSKQHQQHTGTSVGWRRNIYDTVVAPKKVSHTDDQNAADRQVKIPARRLTSNEIRALWRSAIEQTRLLNRMEQENKHLKETEQRLMQMEYEEITPCSKDAARVWQQLLLRDPAAAAAATTTSPSSFVASSPTVVDASAPSVENHSSVDEQAVRDALRNGVPRSRRGEVWQLLAQLRRQVVASRGATTLGGCSSPSDEQPLPPQLPGSYESMLEQFTPDRHAILIDLGRTFPSHPYFRAQLGAGQLSLFNILKAYSLLDREVGYCQGLCFVAGILLMHTKEVEAFELLRYLMFTLGIRRQYKPDMAAVQVQMYQLSRLLHDLHPDLHAHFEKYEISPSLYATPWFITLFSSQFPVGFVARVFDFLLFDGLDVVFKVSVLLLALHKPMLIQCGSFESITMYLKTELTSFTGEQLVKLFCDASAMDVSKKLLAYEAEYAAFQEDASSSSTATSGPRTPLRPPSSAAASGDAAAAGSSSTSSELRRLRAENASLRSRATDLEDKVGRLQSVVDDLRQSQARVNHLEAEIDGLQQSHAKLVDYVYAVDVERAALRRTVSLLRSEVAPDVWTRIEAEVASQPQPPASAQASSLTGDLEDARRRLGSQSSMSSSPRATASAMGQQPWQRTASPPPSPSGAPLTSGSD